MRERPARDQRALRGLARPAEPESDGPAWVVDRLCQEIRAALGVEQVRPIPADSAVALAAAAAGRALESEDGVVVPLLAEDRVLGCVAAEGVAGLDASGLRLVTSLGRLAAALADEAAQGDRCEAALTRLRGADRAKSDFVSTASHELRSPVAVVHGLASTLHLRSSELVPEQVRELAGALHAQSARLLGLIDQLLDLSRAESGSLAVRRRRFAARDWLASLLARLDPDVSDKVEIRIDPRLELETDPDALERVVGNLVVNAVRHGRPPVVVRVVDTCDFRLVVEDAGDGIDPALAGEVFNRFTRGEGSRQAGRGAGLGLSIARSYAEALGGSLHYEDARPHGARFVLRLDDALPAAGAVEPQRSIRAHVR
jgi:signal transduction histidine kinase